MNYTTLLNSLIEHSGKMAKDIIRECSEVYGVEIAQPYLSQLRKDNARTASPEISRAIAMACGAKYSEVLVVQAYLDKAPEVIIEFLEGVRYLMSTSLNASKLLVGEVDEITAEIEDMQQAPLAEFICEYARQFRTDADSLQFELTQAQNKPQEPRWLAIPPELVKQLVFINDSDIRKPD